LPELTLDHDQRTAFVRHLDGMRMAQLVRREPPSHAGSGGGMVQLLARRRRLPRATSRRPVNHTQHCADRELATDLQRRLELLPRPTIHPDLTSLAALPTPNEHGAAGPIQIALLQSKRFADP
jgi:hypothetical protein